MRTRDGGGVHKQSMATFLYKTHQRSHIIIIVPKHYDCFVYNKTIIDFSINNTFDLILEDQSCHLQLMPPAEWDGPFCLYSSQAGSEMSPQNQVKSIFDAIARIDARYEQLRDLQSRIDGKLDALIALHGIRPPTSRAGAGALEALAVLRRLTVKQHCTAQALVAGRTQVQIANMLGVSRNTVKEHIGVVLRRLAAADTHEARTRLESMYAQVTPAEYASVAGGLPLDWAASYTNPDPHAQLYAPSRKVHRTKTVPRPR